MQPNHYDLLGHVPDEPRGTAGQLTRDTVQSRTNTPMRSEDSWVEVASQPSSSSLSSAATTDDIVTTGLRVQQTNSSHHHHRRSRRRRLQHLAAVTTAHVEYSSHEPSSSQDEYEESESESDQVMTSSNEDVARPSPAYPPISSDISPSSDEDDSSTALGMGISSSPFVPQPNVFSHPPVSENSSWTRATEAHRSRPISDVSTSSRRTAIRRNSQASMRPTRRPSDQQHSPYNVISPSYHADHDAALRASLSTLLSCAAAARGLPKSESQQAHTEPSRAQPSSFRLVSESVAMGAEASEEGVRSEAPSPRPHLPRQPLQPVSPYPPQETTSTRAKRRPSASKDRGSSHSSTKKSRRAGNSETSSAVMTWVISAGVVVLFSAISFSAGYVLGREVGKLEATSMGSVLADAGPQGGRASAACGQEAVRGGLKRLRWGAASTGSGVIA
ncbi:hypothetical protein BJY01DRAFT_4440 [Aspergillus pseudoustus]|uniref:REJ domain-containing protein n=1 Tax=Aspergillus pseudoustus TaxID=1810923 RepID=A0ABR4JRY0_9EURO